MDELAKLKEQALQAADELKTPEAFEKAAAVCKLSLDAQKVQFELEAAEYGRKHKILRFLSNRASVISSVVVVATLVFQMYQFKQTYDVQLQTAEVQARSAEDTQWHDAAKAFADKPTAVGGIAATALLKPFLLEGSHQNEARTLAVLMLGGVAQREIFDDLFDVVMRGAADDKLPPAERPFYIKDAIKMLRILRKGYFQSENATHGLKAPPGQTVDKTSPTLFDQDGKSFSNPYFVMEQVNDEIRIASNFVGEQLRKMGNQHFPLDLSDSAMWDCDLTNVNLSESDLSNASIYNANVEGADLSHVARFGDAIWTGTAWWRAKRISKPLLDFLTAKYPFGNGYYGGSTATIEEFRNGLTRLKPLSNE